MKKLIFALSLVAVVTLAAPMTALAQDPVAANQIGIYTTEVDSTLGAAEVSVGPSGNFFAYVCLTKPQDNSFAAVDSVEAFEFGMTFENGADIFVLGATLPPNSIDVGGGDPVNGFDFIVGIGVPIGVNNGGVTLVTLQILSLSGAPNAIFIGPSTVGNLYYQDTATKELVEFYPSSSDPSLPVFGINQTPVATESRTWGNLKSLYR
jgi:hypothetical protein